MDGRAVERASLVQPLAAAGEAQGGKAATLARLIALGVAVPEGVVVGCAAFEQFVAEHQLDTLAAAQTLALDDPTSFTRAAQVLEARVSAAALPSELERELAELALALPGPWIVRSSALGEDSSSDSFAGQLDSILDVRTPAQLADALRRCWASYWSARALFYQHARARRLRGMGVIIQRMITPVRGGVLFSRAPDDPDTIAIEYVEGHPAALVGGEVDPLRLAVPRGTTPAHEPFLSLVATAMRIEQALGGPQDIEWVVERSDSGDALWIVQSRPITTPPPSPKPSAAAKQVFSNVNVNENYPRPISPLLYSIAREAYEHYFRSIGRLLGVREDVLDTIEQPLRHCVGVHGARLYYNLTNIHRCIRAAPQGARLTAAFDGFVGVDDEGRTSARTSVERSRDSLRDLVRVAWVSTRSFLALPRRLARFEARVRTYVGEGPPLEQATVPELLARVHGFLDIRFRRWSDAALADVAASLAFAWLRWTLARTCGPEAAKQLPQSLLLAIPNVVSAGPVEGVWDLSRLARADPALRDAFARLAAHEPERLLGELRSDPRHAAFMHALDDYLRAFGFRVSGELMLTTRSHADDPAALLRLLGPYVEREGPSPRESTRQQAQRRDAAIAEVHARLPLRWRPIFAAALRATQRAIGGRERARLEQARLYAHFRAVVRALGRVLHEQGRLAQADDLLYLTWRELDEWLSGSAMFAATLPELLALRRREHARLSALTPQGTVQLGVGDYLDAGPASPSAIDHDAHTLQGVGVAGGRVEGPARVLVDLSEQGSFRAGDCLVTRQTDPGWAPLFYLAKGLVMERGGMLSHGAIVAREFGIPGVIAVPDATAILREGERIEVDGDQGRVRRLEVS